MLQIEKRGRLIEEQYLGGLRQRASDDGSLPFPAGETLSALSHLGFKAPGQIVEKIYRLGIAQPEQAPLVRELAGFAERTGAGVLKLIVSRGASGRGYRAGAGEPTRIVLAYAPEAPIEGAYRDGVALGWCALYEVWIA